MCAELDDKGRRLFCAEGARDVLYKVDMGAKELGSGEGIGACRAIRGAGALRGKDGWGGTEQDLGGGWRCRLLTGELSSMSILTSSTSIISGCSSTDIIDAEGGGASGTLGDN